MRNLYQISFVFFLLCIVFKSKIFLSDSKYLVHKHRSNSNNSDFKNSNFLDSAFLSSAVKMTTSIKVKNSGKYLNFLSVVTVNIEQLDIFQYWLRWAKIAGFVNFLIFAMDEESAAMALSHKLQTFSPAIIHRFSLRDKIAYRHEFFLSLLNAGISFVSIGVSNFILDVKTLSLPGKEIFLSVRGYPPANTHEPMRLSTDLFGITAKYSKGLEYMRRVGSCFQNGTIPKNDTTNRYLRALSSKPSATLHYQYCMEKSSSEMLKTKNATSFSFLDTDVVANSYQLFKSHIPQSQGDIPPMMLIDEPAGESSKLKLLRDWNLNLEDGENNNPNVPHAPYVSYYSIATRPTSSVVKPTSIVLTIRIITMDRATSLQRLLTSLTNAYYGSDVVHIEFYVDKPKADADQTKNKAVVDIVKAFQWKRGTVVKNFEKQNAGIFNMWVRPFPIKEGNSSSKPYFMVLEDDVELSVYFYSWIKRVLLTYGQYEDANLYGLAIQRSHSVVGVKKGKVWTESFHDKKAPRSSLFYRYQLLSTWGQVFFPRHWNAFVDWAVVAHNQTNFLPCVPYLICNEWYFKGTKKMWSIWFNYFVYQSGLTNLYINYNHLDRNVNYALLVNHREKGLHYFSNSEALANTRLSEVLISESLKSELPSMSRIPLYNFFFDIVGNENLLKHQWRFTSRFKDTCVTNTE